MMPAKILEANKNQMQNWNKNWVSVLLVTFDLFTKDENDNAPAQK